jgi:hypothetical protein
VTRYQAILFAAEGDHVTDYHGCETIEQVWDLVNDQGSRWYFYPLPFVITDSGNVSDAQRIVGTPDGFEDYHGRTIGTVRRELEAQGDAYERMLVMVFT